jgi:putative SOS response-associated peptidase YedK
VLYETDTLDERYDVEIGLELHPNYNTAPTQFMPVITENGLELMRWGLIPKWARDEKISYKLFNARSESVFEKPLWKSVITSKRCLVPANGFYEWKKESDGKHPYYIHPRDTGVFSFAGVWEQWQHRGRLWWTYSILTTEPNKEMTNIHNRMPVILHQQDEDTWLRADEREVIETLLQPYDDNGLDMYEVSPKVNVTATNDASLIGPLNSR